MRTIASLTSILLLSAAPFAGAQSASSAAPAGRASQAAAPVGTTGAVSAAAPDYRLAAGDKLRIEVYKDPQLSQSLQIRPDGRITLPYVGDLPAAGKTSIELRDAIATSLKEYIASPVVTVIVVETATENVYVMGEVNNAGAIPIKGTMSIVQAIAMAGGFKDFAKTKDIRVLRRAPAGPTTLTFNYRDAIKGEGKMLFLQPGDTVIVP